MLEIHVDAVEQYDEEANEFYYLKPQTLKMEHSLVSVSKWESKWHKPFLTNSEKSTEEIFDYIRCMTINAVDPLVFHCLSAQNITDIQEYIDNPMTATVINETNMKRNSEFVTSELIYYWMVALNIPFECEKWHLNRLLTLIRICNIKNQPDKKMSRQETIEQNRILNAARRKQFRAKGR